MRPAFEALLGRVRSAAGPAAARGAAELAAAIRAEAPVASGSLRGSVRETPTRVGPGSAEASAAVSSDHVLAVEYGTARSAPDPFIRRAVARSEGRVATILADAARSALRKGT